MESFTITANYQINNALFYLNNEAQAENLSVEALWKKDTIYFSSHIKQFERNNEANLMGQIGLTTTKISLHFLESEINLLNDKWVFDENNKMDIYKTLSSSIIYSSMPLSL